jgi:hypothetical protein
MKKGMLLLTLICLITVGMAQNQKKSGIYKAERRPIDLGMNMIKEMPSFNGPIVPTRQTQNPLDVLKMSFSSSLNVNGIFSYDERFVTINQTANMFTYGNRAGGVFGNTGNDLKFKYTVNQGTSWDSAVAIGVTGHNYRYPSMVTYNPTPSNTDPHNMFGIYTGPITDGTNWIEQYFGSIQLDNTNNNVTRVANASNIYFNHMDIGLYCSADGHVTVGSSRIIGNATTNHQDGFNVVNGLFNTSTHMVDWAPYDSIIPLVKESGRTDAPGIAWSPDGSVGYFVFTAIDSLTTNNPYGVEWPIIYKSTDHGVTWTKLPAFDFSTIGELNGKLPGTLANPSIVIPRWFNKWADVKNEGQNGIVVDKYNNLHIFGFVRGTMSTNPDSITYFYSKEPTQLFDVYMTKYNSWNAVYVDTLKSTSVYPAGSYGLNWDHQMQMTRTPDGSKVFCTWTDTDPFFASDNSSPDIKGMGFDVDNMSITDVKNFTEGGSYFGQNFWMRVATDAFYDGTLHSTTLPFTTSIPGATNNDPLVHQYVTGATFDDTAFHIPVGIPSLKGQVAVTPVSINHPNPFKGTTQFNINLQNSSNVTVNISSVVGQQISSVNYGRMSEGVHTMTIDGANLSAGVYLYTVIIDGKSYTNKMTVN